MVGNSVEQDGSVSATLVSPKEEAKGEWNQDKVQMKKQLGLLEGVAIILGIIFGSGNHQDPSILDYKFYPTICFISQWGGAVGDQTPIVAVFISPRDSPWEGGRIGTVVY